MNLYNQYLMQHYRNPKNYKRLQVPDFGSIAFNPLCGDKIYLDLKLQEGVISEIGFEGEGCIISLGTASMFFDTLIGQSINSLELLTEKNIIDLIGLELGPNRLKCALLSFEAIKNIIKQYQLNISE